MTPAKQQQKLRAQTNAAQKVYEYIPEDRFVSLSDIATAMHRSTSTRLEMSVMRACARALVDAKLVRRDNHENYQRAPVSSGANNTPIPSTETQDDDMSTKPETSFMTTPSSPARSTRRVQATPAPQPVAAPSEPTPPAAPAPIRRSARELVGGIANSLRTLANQLDEAAAVIDQGTEADQASLEKLGLLREAIKNLNMD